MSDDVDRAGVKPDQVATPPRPWLRTVQRWVVGLAIYAVVLIVVVALVRTFLVQPFMVPSGSMQNTLKVGDTILVWKPSQPQRGEIVVFRNDLDWPLPASPPASSWRQFWSWVGILAPVHDEYLVKRLIGLPGDHVTCCDVAGRITVNGQPLDESLYLTFVNPTLAMTPFNVIVPEGRILVLGDHRDTSADSRAHMCSGTTPTPDLAFPPISSIQGTAFAIVSPRSRMELLNIPSTFATVPASTAMPPPPDTRQWTC